MRNEENIKEILNYFQAAEDKALDPDQEAIVKAYQKNNDGQSMAVKILSIFGGILGSLAFIGFLLIAGLYDSKMGLLVIGTLCISGAIWLNKEYDKIIIDTVSVSSFIIGFMLIGLGLNLLKANENIITIVFIIVAFFQLGIVQNYMLSFISVLIINGGILTLIILNNSYNLIHVYVSVLTLLVTYLFLKEAKIITLSKALCRLYNPVRIGLVFSFLSGLIFLGIKEILPISKNYIWLSSIVTISAIIYLAPLLFNVLNITKTQHKISNCIVAILLLLPTALSPGISAAILIILLSFFVNYKTGLVLGIIAFMYFISQYYYDLNFTLLTKSILLFSSGILFLLLYLFTHKKLTTNEKV